MIQKDNLNKYISDYILSIVYKEKFKTIISSNTQDKAFLSLTEQKDKYYKDILTAIDNIPPCFFYTRQYITESVEQHIKSLSDTNNYLNEKFYKTGFIDGCNFLLELFINERNDSTNE